MRLTPDCPNCSHFASDPRRRNRVTVFKDATGTTHAAPDMWIAGRMDGYERDGMDVMDAHLAAIREWADTCALLIRHGMEAA